jgi:hypothetical protein
MEIKLVEHDGKLLLPINKSLQKKLNFNKSTPVKLAIDEKSLVITSMQSPKKSKKSLEKIAKGIMKTHEKTFKKLAKT